jgi:hypothetical protein
MPTSTFTPLYTITTTSTVTEVSIDISSFTDYTDLVMYIFPFEETADTNGLRLRFNNDTGSNYGGNFQWARNVSAAGTGFDSSEEYSGDSIATAWYIAPGSTSQSTPTTFYIDIHQYRNTNLYKQVQIKARKSNSSAEFNTGIWKSTSAITSIQIRTSGGSGNRVVAGTKIAIWGIKAGS